MPTARSTGPRSRPRRSSARRRARSWRRSPTPRSVRSSSGGWPRPRRTRSSSTTSRCWSRRSGPATTRASSSCTRPSTCGWRGSSSAASTGRMPSAGSRCRRTTRSAGRSRPGGSTTVAISTRSRNNSTRSGPTSNGCDARGRYDRVVPEFELVTDLAPAGDQPEAIAALVEGVQRGDRFQTLLGITGSGKSFAIANVIARAKRPTLVLAPNKSLAAQLAAEFRELFPRNRVEYFVSYYDYYQPEAYIPSSDTYIEKDSSINDEIDRLRHSATSALLTRRDVVIVA